MNIWGDLKYTPDNVLIDKDGRVINASKIPYDDPTLPEDTDVFLSGWQPQQRLGRIDSDNISRIVWPQESEPVTLKKLDIYSIDNPICQIATTDLEESRRIRKCDHVRPFRSILFMGKPNSLTTEVVIEKVGRPERTRCRPAAKRNARDITMWIEVERLNGFVGAMGIDGAQEFFVDWTDGPDRYLISPRHDPQTGWRRLFRFSGYPVTQYYILERRLESELFDADLGYGYTYNIVSGPTVFPPKNWKLVGSFYAFDHKLPCSNKYTVFTKDTPFRRIAISLSDRFDDSEEWETLFSFYAFDVPIPGSCVYQLQHVVRSINSTDPGVRRHRLTTEHPRLPWEYRMSLYVLPAEIADCTITHVSPHAQGPSW